MQEAVLTITAPSFCYKTETWLVLYALQNSEETCIRYLLAVEAAAIGLDREELVSAEGESVLHSVLSAIKAGFDAGKFWGGNLG